MILCNLTAVAQKKPSPGYRTSTTFPIPGPLTLDSLTSFIHHRSRIRFSFNSRKIQGDRVISFTRGGYSLSQILKQVRQGTGLYYFSFKDHIIFQDNPPVKRSPVTQTADHQTAKPANHSATPDAAEHSPVHSPETTIGQRNPVPLTGTYSITPAAAFPKIGTVKPRPLVHELVGGFNDPFITRKPSRWHLQAGAFGSNSLWFNPGIEAGIHPIHAVFSWTTDFDKIHTWRLGLGSVILNRENWQIQLIAAYSPLRTIYPYDSIVLDKKYLLKGQLYNFTIWWCQKLGSHWMLKGGPEFNVLRTVYYVNGSPSPFINQLTFAPENPDTKFTLLRTPWMIYNNFDRNKDNNIKAWINLSIGIYYAIP